ncbi:GGDEF domain-containing protein [Sphingomonas mollis]|uniref:diguanylate cyclase n=1 Tax=Sphingomonas mollis TaxID=2795726 RepID=A0ABS0XTI9_9SPHN|nr:GGDEF domain-containing protein [Sphingomonas sp. BT553]MBJ6123352.1 GGDEF domain-containing protein [Sphingomonas sp. BT553]
MKAAEAAHDPDSAPPRWNLRKLYDDIGLFLFSHRLDLTPLNFGCAHDYVAGSDRRIVDEVNRAIRERRLSNGWIEQYLAGQDSHVVMPDALHDATAQLAEELDRCLDQLGRSTERQKRYGTALDKTVRTASPDVLFTQLRDLTRQMVEQNKLAEIEMRLSHRRVSELRITLRSARQASKQDYLTGLQNRRGFERIVETWQGSQGGVGGVLAICDIDHFKLVNDRFGHDTGDRVLRYVADALHALAEMKHEVARLRGEEFVILMPDRTLDQAAREVNLIRESLGARCLIDRETKLPIGPVTFSAGLTALAKTDALAPALRRADAALYAAKRAGRNCIHAAVDRGQVIPMPG